MSSPSHTGRVFSRSSSLSLMLSLVAGVAGAVTGCSSSSSATADGGVGGPVTGPLDTHCTGVTPITVSAASCNIPEEPPPADGATGPQFGDTLSNAEGDDDDCKYHVKFTVSPAAVKVGGVVTFKVTVTYKVGGAPATGAVNAAGDGIYIESYLSDTPTHTHVLPNPPPVFAETPAGSGIYTAQAKFDASGRWVVRFHLFGNCLDGAEDSPHGHAAFFFDVP